MTRVRTIIPEVHSYRLNGIDALETHYQPKGGGDQACNTSQKNLLKLLTAAENSENLGDSVMYPWLHNGLVTSQPEQVPALSDSVCRHLWAQCLRIQGQFF